MAKQVVMTKISSHKNNPGVHMFTIVHGEGSKRKSETLHGTQAQADKRKKDLGGE